MCTHKRQKTKRFVLAYQPSNVITGARDGSVTKLIYCSRTGHEFAFQHSLLDGAHSSVTPATGASYVSGLCEHQPLCLHVSWTQTHTNISKMLFPMQFTKYCYLYLKFYKESILSLLTPKWRRNVKRKHLTVVTSVGYKYVNHLIINFQWRYLSKHSVLSI